jgi:hypothetical protein
MKSALSLRGTTLCSVGGVWARRAAELAVHDEQSLAAVMLPPQTVQLTGHCSNYAGRSLYDGALLTLLRDKTSCVNSLRGLRITHSAHGEKHYICPELLV